MFILLLQLAVFVSHAILKLFWVFTFDFTINGSSDFKIENSLGNFSQILHTCVEYAWALVQNILGPLPLSCPPENGETTPKSLSLSHPTGWFAIAFPAVVRGGISNLFMVPAIAHIVFTKDTMGSLTSSK